MRTGCYGFAHRIRVHRLTDATNAEIKIVRGKSNYAGDSDDREKGQEALADAAGIGRIRPPERVGGNDGRRVGAGHGGEPSGHHNDGRQNDGDFGSLLADWRDEFNRRDNKSALASTDWDAAKAHSRATKRHREDDDGRTGGFGKSFEALWDGRFVETVAMARMDGNDGIRAPLLEVFVNRLRIYEVTYEVTYEDARCLFACFFA